MDIDGNNQVNLTHDPNRDIEPQFSSNGSGLLFISNRDGNDEIYFAELAWYGGYTRYSIINQVNVSNHSSYDGEPQFSPDGSKIVFEATRDGNYEIYTMDMDGGNPNNLTNNTGFDWKPQFSPTGDKIMFESTRDGNYELYIMDTDGTNLVNLTNNPGKDYAGNFAPDGSSITFSSLRGVNFEIYMVNIDGSNLVNVSNHPGSTDHSSSFQPWP